MIAAPPVPPRPRTPVLLPTPAPRAWATGRRVEVDADGVLRLWERGQARPLARRGAVTRAWLVPPGTRVGRRRLDPDGPVLLLEVRDAAPVALPLRDWLPGDLGFGAVPTGTRLAEVLDLAGVRALLTALDVPQAWSFELDRLQPDDAERLRRGRRPVVVAGRWSPQWFTALATVTVLVFAATYAGTAILDVLTAQRLPLRIQNIVGLLALAAVFAAGVVVLLGSRRRATAAVVDVERTTGLLPGGLEVAQTAAGEIVMADPFGLRTTLPGPEQGGVRHAVAQVQAEVGLRSVRLHPATADGGIAAQPMLELPDTWWRGDAAAADRLQAVLREAGLAWQEVRVPRKAPRSPALDPRLNDDERWPRDVLRPLTPCAVIVAGLGFLLHYDGGPEAPLGLVLAVSVAVTWVAVQALRLIDRFR